MCADSPSFSLPLQLATDEYSLPEDCVVGNVLEPLGGASHVAESICT